MTSFFSPHIAAAAAGAPAVRAKFLQSWLSFPQRYGADAAQLVEILSETRCAAIRAAHALVWLPMELDIEVVEAVAQVTGSQFGELTRAFFLEIMQRPPLGALFELGSRMMGLSPQSFLRWWDKGWGAVYRDCGKVVGQSQDDCRGLVLYRDMPRMCLGSDAFVEAVLGTAYGVYALTGVEGEVRIARRRPDQGELELALEWQPAAARVARA